MKDLSEKYRNKKIIFITGGVMSGLGKGSLASSISLLLNNMNQKTLIQKADPYLNVGAGFLSPFEHGEVFVCKDGTETDLDLGHYMRIADVPLSRCSSFTSGNIYSEIIEKEKSMKFHGQTIQVVPHVTQHIINRIYSYFETMPNYDTLIVEIGGTVGDIEATPFLECIRQLMFRNSENIFSIHLTYVPFIPWSGEWKTKPTQHSINALISHGISPNMIVCRTVEQLPKHIISKVADRCFLKNDMVINFPDFKESFYEIPILLQQNGMCKALKSLLKIKGSSPKMKDWHDLLNKIKNIKTCVKIGIVGKYSDFVDSYKSLYESLEHAGISNSCKIVIVPIKEDANCTYKSQNFSKKITSCDAVILPGGFGFRGWADVKKAAELCYTHGIPCLGICYGFQAMLCSLAELTLKIEATSEEFENDDVCRNFIFIKRPNGNMKLGEDKIIFFEDTKMKDIYSTNQTKEIFRHRYTIKNDDVFNMFKDNNINIIPNAISDDSGINAIEAIDHPWFIGVQYHPELLSTPLKPHPIFDNMIKTVLSIKK